MASEDVKDATEGLSALSVDEKASNGVSEKWGLELPHLYQLAVKFCKDKSGKVLQPTYAQQLQLSALQQQSGHGPCRADALPPLGVLDVIGRDRRQAWQALGELGRPEAMSRYVDLLDSVCPAFRPYAEAHKCDLEARQRQLEEERHSARQEQQEQGRQRLEQMAIQQEQEEARRQEETKRHIKEALNQQTRAQFRAYAEQQYPGSPDQQSVLIGQLQEQHYQQYMQQLYQQQLQQQRPPVSAVPDQPPAQVVPEPPVPAGPEPPVPAGPEPPVPAGPEPPVSSEGATDAATVCPEPAVEMAAVPVPPEREALLDTAGDQPLTETDGLLDESAGEESESADEPSPEVGAASLWTRKDLAEFKQAIRAEGGDAVLKVGHGETVTIRVPTHEDGTCLFWEFATDGYDIGFGVFFEWGPSEDNEVTIHISESEDEEDDPENAEDPERGGQAGSAEERPLTTCVIPVYRRDCHQEVYAGSHVYPGQGVYQLKFDNSYSLWRSKTLYYRVYYTR